MKKLLTLAILAVLLLQTVSVGWAWQIERLHRHIGIKDIGRGIDMGAKLTPDDIIRPE